MSKLGTNPEVIRLAHQLGLGRRGDCVERIRRYALQRVEEMVSRFPIETFETFLRLVSAALGVHVEFVTDNEDLDRLASQHAAISPTIRRQLIVEFLESDTEGYLLQHPHPGPGDRRFVAFVDARGGRSRRAYFTAWHEITHLLIHPSQLPLPGFRRTVPWGIENDPVESLVNVIAGELAFYEPLFRPVLDKEIERDGRLTFGAIERARARATPEASLFAAAIASVKLTDKPNCLLRIEHGLKRAQLRQLVSPQLSLGREVADPSPQPRLRAVEVIPNEAAKRSSLQIFKNMRVPPTSVLHRVYESPGDMDLEAREDQSSWETTAEGRLPALPVVIEAVRRGRYVYGLISTETT